MKGDDKRTRKGRSTIGPFDAATEQYIKDLQARREFLGVRHNAKTDVINDVMLEHKQRIGLPPLPEGTEDPKLFLDIAEHLPPGTKAKLKLLGIGGDPQQQKKYRFRKPEDDSK